jgi:hypothetical protein
VTVDPFLTYDAVYVLGALTDHERRDYEQHLRGCERCTVAVRELAGLPGLLLRSQPDEITAGPALPPPPSTLLPRLLASVPKQRLRARVATLTAMAAAACLLVVVTLVAVRPHHVAPTAAPAATAMAHVIAAPINAEASLTAVAWGTRIDVRCIYRNQHAYPASGAYVLVVIDRTGQLQQAASWRVVPGKVSSITASTRLTRAESPASRSARPQGSPCCDSSPNPTSPPRPAAVHAQHRGAPMRSPRTDHGHAGNADLQCDGVESGWPQAVEDHGRRRRPGGS